MSQSISSRSASNKQTGSPRSRARQLRTVRQVSAAPLSGFSVEGLEGRRLLSASLIENLNPVTGSSAPFSITAAGSVAYFVTSHVDGGYSESGSYDLWKTDGTSAGTSSVSYAFRVVAVDVTKDLTAVGDTLFYSTRAFTPTALNRLDPGTTAATPLTSFTYTGADIQHLTRVNNTLFFEADEGTNSDELWTSGGTAATTTLVAGFGNQFVPFSIGNLTSANGLLYFTAKDSTHGNELWRSDGTVAGTVMVADISPGAGSSSPGNITAVGSTVYFTANDGAHGTELWKTDSTGTAMVTDIIAGGGSASPSNLTNVNGTLFFTATDGVHGVELWKAGPTGASMVTDTFPGAGSSSPAHLTNFNGTLLYTATSVVAGNELWRSDGTAAGTALVKDVFPGNGSSNASQLTVVAGATPTLYFAATDSAHGTELWKSDGTGAGTTLVDDIIPGSTSSSPTDITAFNGTVLFAATDTLHGNELWSSDGTAAGTHLVQDIDYGRRSATPGPTIAIGNKVVFSLQNGPTLGVVVSDGTAAGTHLIKSGVYISLTADGLDRADGNKTFVAAGSKGFFADTNGGLWSTDGTAVGTQKLATLTGTVVSNPAFINDMTLVNGRLFFSGTSSAGIELWTSDGTAAGTFMVKDLAPGHDVSSNYPNNGLPQYITDVDGVAYFTASDNHLWRSDGTAAGTVQVDPSSTYSKIDAIGSFDGRAYFLAAEGNGADELWQSDGTAAGTTKVTLGITCYPSWSPMGFDGMVYFAGRSGSDTGVYRYDPATGASTFVFTDDLAGQQPVVSGNGLYFLNNLDHDLWRVDGTTGTGSLIRSFASQSGDFSTEALRDVAGTLYFVASYSPTSRGLWQSDGTPAGTVPATNTMFGVQGAQPMYLTPVGSNLLFFAAPSDPGTDLWWVSNPAILPAAPTNLSATVPSGTEIDLSWLDHADNEDGFRLQRSQSSTFDTLSATFQIPQNVHNYRDMTVPAGTVSYYRLVAYTAAGDSSAVTVSASTDFSPIAPSSLLAHAFSPTQINLIWSDNSSDETGFLLERSLYADFAAIDQTFNLPANSGTSDSYSDTSVVKNTTYYYRVRAVNEGGQSAPANSNVVSTPQATPAGPSNLTLSVMGPPGDPPNVVLHWTNNADNAAAFVIQRRTEPGGAYVTITTLQGVQTGYGDGTAHVGGTYTYRVYATNNAGGSALSNEAEITVVPLAAEVKDIDPTGGSMPKSLVSFNGALYFSANDGVHGRELWKTDGTAAGTVLVADINTQGASSNPDHLTVFNGSLYFSANDGLGGDELWKSDGTAAGTVMVKDVVPGTASQGLLGFIVGTSHFYFLSTNIDGTYSLWGSDGTAAGTTLIPSVQVVADFALPNLGLVTIGDTAYFVGTTPATGQAVWKADATGATSIVNVRSPIFGSGSIDLTAVGASLYFLGVDSAGFGLFKIDTIGGTTTKVAGPFGPTSNPSDLVATPNGVIYFEAANNGVEQIWRSDGTTAGTATLQSLVPTYTSGGAANLTVVGNSVYFVASDPVSAIATRALFRTDGTTDGTQRILSVYPGQYSAFAVSGNVLYFLSGGSLLRTDGTVAGTVQIERLASLTDYPPTVFATVGDTFYFSADPDTQNRELYEVSATPPQAAPSSLAVTLPAIGTAKLNWTDTTDNEAGFWIDRSLTPDFSRITATLYAPQDATVAYDTAYTPGVVNYYRIRAYNAAGQSGNGATAMFSAPMPSSAPQPVVIPPGNVPNLSVNPGTQQINLVWGTAPNATGYTVERSLDGVNFTSLTTVPILSSPIGEHYEDTTVLPYVTYWYRVRAFNAAGASAYSSAFSSTPFTVRPNQSAGFTGTDATTGGSWLGRIGDQFFAVAGDSENINITGQTPITWAASTSDPRALDKSSANPPDRIAAAWSSDTSFTLNLPIRPNTVNESFYAVDWDNAGRSERFDVIDATNNQLLDSRTISNFQNGIYLSWDIRGSVKIVVTKLAGPNAVVSGAFGEHLTPSAAPSALTATSAAGAINLAWTDNATNEQGTRIERSIDDLNFSVIGYAGPNVATYSDTTATPGTIYYYKAQTFNGFSDSDLTQNFVRASAKPGVKAPAISSVSPIVGSAAAQKIIISGSSFIAGSVVTLVNLTTGQTFSTASSASSHPTIVAQTASSLTVQAIFGTAASNWTVAVSSTGGTSAAFAFSVTPAKTITAIATRDAGKKTIQLLVVGGSPAAGTKYAWKVTSAPSGAPATTFLRNNSAAAVADVATVGKAGTYTFAVTISDGVPAHTVTRTVTVVVTAAAATLALSPTTATLARGATQQFTLTAKDQFGKSFTPTGIVWSVVSGDAGGTISSTGLYTAPAAASGSATIKVAANGLSATATVKFTTPVFTPVKIDFAPASAAVASGYIRDSGLTYAARTASLTFGWSISESSNAVDRNKASSRLLDTNIGVLSGATWNLAVPNGVYKVKVGVGDAKVATTNTVRVEGTSLYAAAKQAAGVFSNKTAQVTVSDGKITLDFGSAASLATRLTFLEVTKV